LLRSDVPYFPGIEHAEFFADGKLKFRLYLPGGRP
jgi:hypothetical protein